MHLQSIGCQSRKIKKKLRQFQEKLFCATNAGSLINYGEYSRRAAKNKRVPMDAADYILMEFIPDT